MDAIISALDGKLALDDYCFYAKIVDRALNVKSDDTDVLWHSDEGNDKEVFDDATKWSWIVMPDAGGRHRRNMGNKRLVAAWEHLGKMELGYDSADARLHAFQEYVKRRMDVHFGRELVVETDGPDHATIRFH